MSKNYNAMLITVITVSYNAAEALALTATSVLGQSLDSFEYIIVDGGSSDGTRELLERLERDFASRSSSSSCSFRYVSEPDGGIYEAMNKGAQMADGRWVIYLNAGDRFNDGEVLSRAADVLRDTSAAIVYGDTIYDYGQRQELLRADKPLGDLAKRMIFCHQSVFVLRALYLAHPYDLRYRICADFEFFNAMYKRVEHFLAIPDFVVSVYEARGGVSSKRKARLAREVYRIRTSRGDCLWFFKYVLVRLRDCLFNAN